MNIKILGTGCAKCQALENKVRNIIEKEAINAEITKVTDLKKIMSYGVMMTPGLVINEKVVSFGNIPSESQILSWIKESN
jgi:small redox-active disulfide protein 2